MIRREHTTRPRNPPKPAVAAMQRSPPIQSCCHQLQIYIGSHSYLSSVRKVVGILELYGDFMACFTGTNDKENAMGKAGQIRKVILIFEMLRPAGLQRGIIYSVSACRHSSSVVGLSRRNPLLFRIRSMGDPSFPDVSAWRFLFRNAGLLPYTLIVGSF